MFYTFFFTQLQQCNKCSGSQQCRSYKSKTEEIFEHLPPVLSLRQAIIFPILIRIPQDIQDQAGKLLKPVPRKYRHVVRIIGFASTGKTSFLKNAFYVKIFILSVSITREGET